MTDVPRSERFDDVYFSVQDGLAESRHVFLDGNNLPYAWQGKEKITICETGFGTGLNFLAVLQLLEADPESRRPEYLHYISFEKYPLEKSFIRDHLSQWEELKDQLDTLLAKYPPDSLVGTHNIAISDSVSLTLVFGDVNQEMEKLNDKIDFWFLDGFKPSTNPDMWTETVFQNMARLSREGASFATFTAAGFVRRGLESAGFEVRKVPGFGRKREMCVGNYAADSTS